MTITSESKPFVNGVNSEKGIPEKRGRVLSPRGNHDPKEKNLKKLAKKNNMREKIIVDVIDDDISRVDNMSPEEMDEYNREYEHFMTRAKNSMPIYPVEKVMVANIQDYLKYSKDNNPAMVFFSEDLKIPLLTIDNGSEMKPHSNSTGIYYILEGKGTIRVGMKNYAIHPGSLIHVPKGVIRSIQCEDSLKIMAIHIS